MSLITPCLWFDDEAEEAAAFYTSIVRNSRIVDTSYYGEAGPGTAGTVMTVSFELDGQSFTALNGGPVHNNFSAAISLQIDCADQAEVDQYWDALTDGGEEIACGWLKDRYGVHWQIIPRQLIALVTGPDREQAERVTEAMLQMKKLDVAALEEAAATSRV